MAAAFVGKQAKRRAVAAKHDGLLRKAVRAETRMRALVVLDVAEGRMPIKVVKTDIGAEIDAVGELLGKHVAIDMAVRCAERVERHQVKAAGDAQGVASSIGAIVAVIVPYARREIVARVDRSEIHIAVVPIRTRRKLPRVRPLRRIGTKARRQPQNQGNRHDNAQRTARYAARSCAKTKGRLSGSTAVFKTAFYGAKPLKHLQAPHRIVCPSGAAHCFAMADRCGSTGRNQGNQSNGNNWQPEGKPLRCIRLIAA